MHQTLEHLCLLTFVVISDSKEVLRNARRVAQHVRTLIKAEEHNARILRKWEMLLTPSWRDRVLRELGGEGVLLRWERRMGLARPKPRKRRAALSPAQKEVRHQNLLKARAAKQKKNRPYKHRPAMWNDRHPNVYKDRVKVDMAGQFRLAPILRGRRKIAAQAIKTPPKMRRVTGIKYTKINPIPILPIEFRMAEKPLSDFPEEELPDEKGLSEAQASLRMGLPPGFNFMDDEAGLFQSALADQGLEEPP